MKANETKVEDSLSSNKTQFVIPVYQRNYDWLIVQCKHLLDDILEVGSTKKQVAHFIGSIVFVHDNRHLATLDCWNKLEIEKRFNLIAERFLKIWEYPNVNIETASDNEEINIFDAEVPTRKQLEYIIFCGEKIELNSISAYYVEIFKKLFELQPETFFTTDLGGRIRLSKLGEESVLRRSSPINDTYFVESSYSAKDLFDRIKQALTIFDFEDELIIKYAE